MNKIYSICIILILSFYLTACSKPITTNNGSLASKINNVSTETPQTTTPSSMAPEEYKKKVEEKGLTERMVKTLGNLGYSEQEILNLPPEKIAEIFAPGTPLDGAGLFTPNESQIEELKKVNIDIKMSLILGNLGYIYDEMLKLTPKEIDFIFPNTNLRANLAQNGISEQKVQNWLDQGKTYKEIINETLKN